MADISKASDGPVPSDRTFWDVTSLPEHDTIFISEADIAAFAAALSAPEPSPSQDDILTGPAAPRRQRGTFITALNDWRPVRQRVRKRKKPSRGRDETREGYLYAVLKWPLLATVLGWIAFLGGTYLLTRLYIFLYEHLVTWRGKRERLRRALREQTTYEDWVRAATRLDAYLGNDRWKTVEDNAYYDSKTVKRVRNHMRKFRQELEAEERNGSSKKSSGQRPVDELRALAEASIRDNFVGFESPRLYSETYYGTKALAQSFVDEAETSLSLLQKTDQLDNETKQEMWKHLQTNFGRTALCLSGGATFAYYHFGVAKALLDANLLPQVITGTSGGALVATLLATRTDEELKDLIVPALAHKITACSDGTWTWARRWWKTGARFDAVDWARQCSWFTRGSMTFREAYERTGRILNISCVPSDPHSPTILANYLTSPDCVIWSAALASAAVPGILNPVVLMKKNRDGSLEPYSFGHKWKDGSLRTDIPLRALNLHFNVNFTIVSQVNPHINLFFFSSRGTVGRPVTHRKGRGWRGGFLGSATEQYIKLDLTKWLKVLRHLELLPRPLGQDWSQLWLQRFSGTITIWPKSVPSDFYHILTDPTPPRLARMIHTGQLSTWPKLKFIANRMKLERIIDEGRKASAPPNHQHRPGLANLPSESEIQRQYNNGFESGLRHRIRVDAASSTDDDDDDNETTNPRVQTPQPLNDSLRSPPPTPGVLRSPTLARMRNWFNRTSSASADDGRESPVALLDGDAGRSPVYAPHIRHHQRRSSTMLELARQSGVFFDDDDFDEDISEGERGRRVRNEYHRGGEGSDGLVVDGLEMDGLEDDGYDDDDAEEDAEEAGSDEEADGSAGMVR